MRVMLCVNATKAQVVLQVGRKANWSNSNSLGNAGLNHSLTNIFSARRERIGVTDIQKNWQDMPSLARVSQ